MEQFGQVGVFADGFKRLYLLTVINCNEQIGIFTFLTIQVLDFLVDVVYFVFEYFGDKYGINFFIGGFETFTYESVQPLGSLLFDL